jgi:hypothetical protein
VWVAVLGAAVGLGLFALPSASALTSAECDAQVNDTPSKLLPCIRTDDLWKYMQDFQAIADANPSPADGHPSRNSGEPGYKASADYVANLMKEWGYDVTIQTYKFDYYAYTGIPSFSVYGTWAANVDNREWSLVSSRNKPRTRPSRVIAGE